jgi:hypothetical protein
VAPVKIFVLGRSGSGKTPMARRLAEALGLEHAPASAWVRARFPTPSPAPDASGAERQAFVDAITRFAVAELRRDPWVSLDHLVERHRLDGCVIEGMRNPLDFVHAFDPRHDAVVWLEHTRAALAPTAFESGLDVIDGYLAWLERCGLAGGGPCLRYRYAAFRRGDEEGDTLDDAIDDAIARLRPLVAPPAEQPRTARVHADIPPLRCHVRAELLYGGDPARVGELRACSAFSVSSYPGHVPTFQILLPDGAVFSYVPPSGLVDPDKLAAPELELEDLVYFACPDERICVHRHAALEGEVLAYFKRKDLWLGGRYLFTVEWWTGNDLCHAVALDNGQLAMLPHHKLKFGSGHAAGFEPYRKMRKLWRL